MQSRSVQTKSELWENLTDELKSEMEPKLPQEWKDLIQKGYYLVFSNRKIIMDGVESEDNWAFVGLSETPITSNPKPLEFTEIGSVTWGGK